MDKQNGYIRFLIIWFGDFISTIGSGLTAFCLGVYVFNVTGKATASAMVVLFSFLPMFLMRPIGGVLADRIDRTFLMVIGNVGSALGISLVLILLTLNPNHLLMLYPGIILSSIFFALQNPAYKACVTDFIPPDQYAKASGLVQLSSAAQFLISPLLGGVMISMMKINYVLIIDIATFVFSAAAVFIVRIGIQIPKKEISKKDSIYFFKEMMEGIRPIMMNRGILILVSLLSALLFCIGLVQALSIPLVLSFASASSLGMAQFCCGIGMLLTSILISMFERKRKNITVLCTALLFMGIFFSFIGIVPSIWAIIIPGFLFFLATPFANSSIDVLIRKNINNEIQGRAWSIIFLITSMGSLVAYSISGFLADKIFNPLFMANGALANSVGIIFGVGPGRGIAFMFFISGILIIILSLLIYRSRSIHQLEDSQDQSATVASESANLMT